MTINSLWSYFKFQKTTNMDNILTLNTATLKVDFDRGYLVIDWDGVVDFEDYKLILSKAAEICDVHNIKNVILNRLKLKELSTECRVWMKNYFLKHLIKPLIPKLSKVATIESQSVIGQVYTKTISKTVSFIYPNLKFKSFASEDAAFKWLYPGDVREIISSDNISEREDPIKKPLSVSTTREMEELAVPPSSGISSNEMEEKTDSLLNKFYQLFFSKN